MKEIFIIEGVDIREGELYLIGRTIEDFNKEDILYLKNNKTNEYRQIRITKIIAYRREFDELYSGLTAGIFIKGQYDSFDGFDNYLYLNDN
ncbi:hypothetical protein SAMN02745163_02461 [Clostridium cavendishii DSM 21758]|uniref:Uncharacterized protein n=1 Tax=Clostridium cavendishii DSM 21758 TaxID=1121302 RepID=A0A1M6LQY5_9CLOT|nr:hypothetical protein [Clostridium cavendishii]SHJ73566.1 hypothetical protein SAMN02745163_02461 [Clostridium cavendishii DSM 21758]